MSIMKNLRLYQRLAYNVSVKNINKRSKIKIIALLQIAFLVKLFMPSIKNHSKFMLRLKRFKRGEI